MQCVLLPSRTRILQCRSVLLRQSYHGSKTSVRNSTRDGNRRCISHVPKAQLTSRCTRVSSTITCRRRDNDGYGGPFSRRRAERESQGLPLQLSAPQLAAAVGGLVAFSIFLGPIIASVAFSAIAMGAAMSAGALMFGLFAPFILFAGFGFFLFGGLSFTGFLGLGLLTFIPKIMSLAVAAVGIGVGWGLVNMFLNSGNSGSSSATQSQTQVNLDELRRQRELEASKSELDRELLSASRELKDFDVLLAEREEKKRMDKWRN